VPAASLLLALCAAFVHAGWNLVLSRARDSEAATATAALIGAIGFAPVAALTWRVGSQALPYAAGSAALELVYLALLARAYQEGEISVVYPVARGSAPLLILVFSVAVLGVSPSALAIAGVCLVGTGVMVLRGSALAARPHDFRLALAIAAAIASYTLLDKYGLRHADALPYVELVVGPPAVVYFLMLARRRGASAMRAELRPETFAAAVAIFGAFALALAAIKLAPTAAVASVQAVRETSVVIAVVLARLVLGERVTRARLAGATVVLAGVAAIAAG
jgi:drug/metabolite transporter (DMT)-like permease